MIAALTYISGIYGTKFQKKEIFSKKSGLTALVEAAAWQAAASRMHYGDELLLRKETARNAASARPDERNSNIDAVMG